MTKPLVSITMGTYNRPIWVREALDSIYRQEMQDFEIILVRDGGLPVQVKDYDDRLKFIDRGENKGFAYSLNEAIQHAQGKYIAYLGDDDKMYPHHLKTLVEAIECFNGEMVYSDLYKVYCKNDNGKRTIIKKSNEISRDFDRNMMLHMNHTLGGAMMHTKSLLDKTGPYRDDIKVYIDWDMTRRMCFYTDFLHVPKITGEFYAPVNKTDRISVKQRLDRVAFDAVVDNIKKLIPLPPWSKIEHLTQFPRSSLYFDNLYHVARGFDNTTPAIAARLYRHLRLKYGNTNWMLTREAKSWLECGSYVEAYELAGQADMPTTETLEIRARALQGMGKPYKAYDDMIKAINNDKIYWDNVWKELK